MSYDLNLFARKDKSFPSISAWHRHFQERRNYNVSEHQARYQNENTGVYFSFDYAPDSDKGQEGDAIPIPHVYFNMNYYRPHVFGLEAEPEVSAFVEAFDLVVDDPQTEGMGRGEYSPEGFLRGWNAGNRFGYRAILSTTKGPEQVNELPTRHVLPAQRLEQIWRWNYELADLREKMDDAFVPLIWFVRYRGKVASVVAWIDAIPVVLPEVDLLYLGLKDLSAKGAAEDETQNALASWEDLRPLLKRAKRLPGRSDCFILQHDKPPPDLVRFFRQAQPVPPKTEIEGLSPDQILNEELVLECQRGVGPRGSHTPS